MKKSMALLLSLVMLFSIIVPFAVYADSKLVTDKVSLLQNDDMESVDSLYSTTKLDLSAYTSLIDTLLSSFRRVASSVSVSTYRIKPAEFRIVYAYVINENPDLFYLSSNLSYGVSAKTGYVTTVTPQYSMTSAEIEDAKIVFNNGVNKALSLISSDMTDVQKALVIHDYICSISRYPKMTSQELEDPIYHSAYGIMYNGDTVCAGFTLLYSYLMKQIGIPSCYIISPAMGHAWNAIQIDGSWYYVDLTYDDVDYYGDINTYGTMLHRCFLKSKYALSSDIGFYHYDYSEPSYVDCSDTRYDDYFWNDIDTNIEVVNGEYYYPYIVDSSARKFSIVKRDVSGNQVTVSNSLMDYTYTNISGNYPDENGNTHSVSFRENFIRLRYHDDRFFVTGHTKFYTMDMEGNVYTNFSQAASLNTLIIGMDVFDNEAVVQYYNSVTSPVKYNKIDFFNQYFGATYNNYADVNNDKYVNVIDYLLITKDFN